eukprot:4945905-Pleurochrysis_carterae.AAC.1
MECPGKLHIALSEAMGRPPMVAALCAGASAVAVELAAADWAALLERAGGPRAAWGGRELLLSATINLINSRLLALSQ